jgi:hypothetical protein
LDPAILALPANLPPVSPDFERKSPDDVFLAYLQSTMKKQGFSGEDKPERERE